MKIEKAMRSRVGSGVWKSPQGKREYSGKQLKNNGLRPKVGLCGHITGKIDCRKQRVKQSEW